MQRQLLKQPSIVTQLILVCGLGLLLGIVATKIPVELLLIGISGVIYIVVAWFWPEIAVLGILLFTSTIFDIYAYPSIPIGIGRLIVSDILLFILIGILFLRLIHRSSSYFVHTPLDLPLLTFYVTAILSTAFAIFNSRVTFNGSLEEVRVVNFYLIFFIITHLIRNEKQLHRLLKGIIFLAFFTALAMIAQYILGPGVPILPGRVEILNTAGTISYGVTRILPPGQSLVMLGFVCLAVQMLFDKKLSRFMVYLIELGVVGLAVLLTFNRSFWGAIATALLLVILFVSLRDKVKYAQIALWIVLIGFFILIPFLTVKRGKVAELVNGITARMETLFNPNTAQEGSVQFRFIENEYAIPQILSHPFIGLGLGANYRPWDFRLDGRRSDLANYIHNGHLWIMLKTGLIGYLFFMCFLLMFIKRAIQNWRQVPDPFLKGIVLSFAVTLVGVLVATFANPVIRATYWAPVIGVMVGSSEVILRMNHNQSLDSQTLGELNLK